MNANELADNISLDNCHLDHADRLSIATMLRQQQATIEQYEKSTDYWMKLCQEANAKNEALKNQLDTANKAYMWMDETYKGNLAEIEALKQSKSDGNNKVKMKETTEEYIAKLKAGLATLETALYEAKMSAQEVNTRKNKQIAEQQTDIGELKLILAQQEIHVECYRNQLIETQKRAIELRKAQEK